VEVAEFRPVFVVGGVQTPGKYPYEPGMTVLKLLSVAGGLRHSADAGQRYERDFIKAQGEYQVDLDQWRSLLVQKARIEAQIAGKSSIDLPQALAKDAGADALAAHEIAIMQPADQQYRLHMGQLDDLKTLLQDEIESLGKKSTTQNRQLDLAKQDLKQVGSLADKGLTVNERVLTAEQQVTDLESKILDNDTASLKAKQDINKAEQDETTLKTARATGLAQALQDTDAQLARLETQMAMGKGLMLEAASGAGSSVQGAGGQGEPEAKYSIVREANGKTTTLSADENAPVLPGDIVKIELVVAPM